MRRKSSHTYCATHWLESNCHQSSQRRMKRPPPRRDNRSRRTPRAPGNYATCTDHTHQKRPTSAHYSNVYSSYGTAQIFKKATPGLAVDTMPASTISRCTSSTIQIRSRSAYQHPQHHSATCLNSHSEAHRRLRIRCARVTLDYQLCTCQSSHFPAPYLRR